METHCIVHNWLPFFGRKQHADDLDSGIAPAGELAHVPSRHLPAALSRLASDKYQAMCYGPCLTPTQRCGEYDWAVSTLHRYGYSTRTSFATHTLALGPMNYTLHSAQVANFSVQDRLL